MRRRQFRRALGLILPVALAGSVIANVVLWERMSRRVSALEKVVSAREAADPLMPPECAIAEGMGTTPERPCLVEFQRLYRWPQQFAGRWVVVEGRYADGFEMSALFPAEEAITDETLQRMLRERRGLWVDIAWRDGQKGRIMGVIGKFEPGPAGHLGQYFGRLTQAAANP